MNQPVLVTGATGFAGSHLLDLLSEEDQPVVAWYHPSGHSPRSAGSTGPVAWRGIDLRDRAAVMSAVQDARPHAVYHFAGAADVGASWEHSSETLATNILGTHHLLDALREADVPARVLIPSSALVYQPSSEPIGEDHPLGPIGPYGVSKLAQEMRGLRAASIDGQIVVLPRPFNHLGPRQSPSYAASSFARQIALIESGRQPPVLEVGNLAARRDLTDVRDTVRAYRLLLERATPGRPYNVCSGRDYSMRELLDQLLVQARARVDVRVDEARLRPYDTAVLIGDPRRIQNELGWTPAIPIERTLLDLLNYWRDQVAAAA